ncbi:MAG TPA: hypothetical protein V6D26_25680 [Stenomitos sp.]
MPQPSSSEEPDFREWKVLILMLPEAIWLALRLQKDKQDWCIWSKTKQLQSLSQGQLGNF